MAGLEAVLRIGARDDTSAAFEALKKHVAVIDAQVGALDKVIAATSKVTAATDPMASSVANAQRALNVQRDAILGVTAAMEKMEGAGGAAGGAQARLAGQVEAATRAMVAQGVEAQRVSERIVNAQKRAAGPGAPHGGPGGVLGAIGDALPFAGPGILHETAKAAEAGATVQERIAQLMAAGAKPEQIAQARADFREFSKTHAGVLESDYLGGYKDARVIAPAEAFDMAKHGAVFRSALRNSGLSVDEHDVGDALRIMDELGLKTDEQRKEFLNQILKTEQTFGDQVPIGTMLSAIRNAKQSVYQMSPDFINKYLPTLLQSSGQQGGTEIMTAYSNYIGQHMQHAELVALAAAGFANNKDLLYDKNGKVKGVKQSGKFFEEGLFESNVAEWSWKMHEQYMSRKGSTEEGFDKLIAKMPRNMAAMIAFWTHNEARVKRDADTREGAIGDKAADNSALARNPVAGLDALKQSIENFGAAVTAPGMEKLGAGLASIAQGVQTLGAAYGDFAAKNPQAASALGIGGVGASAAAGGYLTWKLFSGIGRMLGWGGDAAAGGGSAMEGGLLGGLTGSVLRRLGVLGGVIALTESLDPKGDFGGLFAAPDKWFKDHFGFDPSNVPMPSLHSSPSANSGPPSRIERGMLPYLNNQDLQGIGNEFKVSLDPNSKAEVIIQVTVSPTGELLNAVATAKASSSGSIAASVGRMDGDAAPIARGALGRR